jgi:hypothetical protein
MGLKVFLSYGLDGNRRACLEMARRLRTGVLDNGKPPVHDHTARMP